MYFSENVGGASGQELASCLGHHQHGDFVPSPVLGAQIPNQNLKKPLCVVVSYFLITRGIIYDVIVEAPSAGSVTG